MRASNGQTFRGFRARMGKLKGADSVSTVSTDTTHTVTVTLRSGAAVVLTFDATKTDVSKTLGSSTAARTMTLLHPTGRMLPVQQGCEVLHDVAPLEAYAIIRRVSQYAAGMFDLMLMKAE